MSVIITLIIFSIIVVIHEWGHFIVSRLCNVQVDEFAIGMGPKLIGYKKEGGETLYSIRALPLGGFCRMADEVSDENSRRIGFNDANVWQRIAISVAGPMMNFVLALVILTGITICTGITTNKVNSVIDNSVAKEAGIQVGDRISKVDGKNVRTQEELQYYLAQSGGNEITLVLKRNGEIIEKNIIPRYSEKDGRYIIGVGVEVKAPIINVMNWHVGDMPSANIFECIYDGFWEMVFLVKVTVLGVVQMLTMQVSLNDVSGPIGITTVVGEAYTMSIKESIANAMLTMGSLAALLSANLGVINLVPIPALDGGRIVIYLIELIRRKKMTPEREGIIHLIGFALIMGLGVFIALHDIIKLV